MQLAAVATPLAAATTHFDAKVSTWLISASGGNSDIVACFSALADHEPEQLVVMCGRKTSRLTSAALQHEYVDQVIVANPAGRDGFLATNSLIAFAVVACRAYAAAHQEEFPTAEIRSTFEPASWTDTLRRWRAATAQLWTRETTLVLHGATTQPAAIDLESRFTEAALGHIQVADYRNFAHGRHHWIAKHRKRTAVLALSTAGDTRLAAKTLKAIPRDILTTTLAFSNNFLIQSLESIVAGMQLAGWAGIRKRTCLGPRRDGQ